MFANDTKEKVHTFLKPLLILCGFLCKSGSLLKSFVKGWKSQLKTDVLLCEATRQKLFGAIFKPARCEHSTCKNKWIATQTNLVLLSIDSCLVRKTSEPIRLHRCRGEDVDKTDIHHLLLTNRRKYNKIKI